MLNVSPLRVEAAVLMGRSAQRRQASQSPSREFTGRRMVKGSWQMFTGQEMNLSPL